LRRNIKYRAIASERRDDDSVFVRRTLQFNRVGLNNELGDLGRRVKSSHESKEDGRRNETKLC
jgi:hypothetical protein